MLENLQATLNWTNIKLLTIHIVITYNNIYFRNRSLLLALPEELKVIIFGLAVKGDIITHRNLQTVYMDIRQILHNFNLTLGPRRIYFNPSAEDAFNPSRLPEVGISVRKKAISTVWERKWPNARNKRDFAIGPELDKCLASP